MYLPAVQLAREAAVFGLAGKIFRHDPFGKEASVVYDKRVAVRQPADRVLAFWIAEAFHQALRKDLRVVVLHLCGAK